tara:strand:- start:625 stop:1581 length:957 start_codon:yes stop_codon:yes gene_type:complete
MATADTSTPNTFTEVQTFDATSNRFNGSNVRIYRDYKPGDVGTRVPYGLWVQSDITAVLPGSDGITVGGDTAIVHTANTAAGSYVHDGGDNYRTNSIYQGLRSNANKSASGSQHCFTASGALTTEINEGYAELGMFQGLIRNNGHSNGLLSGCEVYVTDSNEAGTPTATRMTGLFAQVTKNASTNRFSYGAVINSAGSQYADAGVVIKGNWSNGISMGEGAYQNSAILLAQSHRITWSTTGAGSTSLTTNVNGMVQIRAGNGASSGFQVRHADDSVKFQVASYAADPIYLMFGGTLKQVLQGATNSGGGGYRMLIVAN